MCPGFSCEVFGKQKEKKRVGELSGQMLEDLLLEMGFWKAPEFRQGRWNLLPKMSSKPIHFSLCISWMLTGEQDLEILPSPSRWQGMAGGADKACTSLSRKSRSSLLGSLC